jgi:hypothetical protein
VSRAQLSGLGYTDREIGSRVRQDRWQIVSPTVVATLTGTLTREQLDWAGVLHGGRNAVLAGLTALEVHGLRNWHRDDVTVMVPKSQGIAPLAGVRYRETRRDLSDSLTPGRRLPVLKAEPAALLFAAYERNRRTAEGVLAALVQQRLTTPASLREWVDRLQPLRRTQQFLQAVADFEGGSHSVGERGGHPTAGG